MIFSTDRHGSASGGELVRSVVYLGSATNWCERLDRRFLFCWWEGRNGASAAYAMQARVAQLSRDARD
jgi:Family of unknown function (DUF6416)